MSKEIISNCMIQILTSPHDHNLSFHSVALMRLVTTEEVEEAAAN